MRAGPHARVAARADEVPGGIDLDVEARLAHPAGGELVRAVFLRRVADAIADRVDLFDPLQQAHERSLHETSPRVRVSVLGGLRASGPVQPCRERPLAGD